MSGVDKLTKYYMKNSQDRLDPYEGELTFEEMLEIYGSADLPMGQKKWKVFWEDFKKKAPLYEGGDLFLYRGTSVETHQKYGGICWTPDRELAEHFALLCCSIRYQMFGAKDKTPLVVSALIPAGYIIFKQTNHRGEEEVFVDWERLMEDRK